MSHLEPQKRTIGFVRRFGDRASDHPRVLVGVWTPYGPEVELRTETEDGTAVRAVTHDDASSLHGWLVADDGVRATLDEVQAEVSAWLALDPSSVVFRVERSHFHEPPHKKSVHRTLAGAQKRAAEHLSEIDRPYEYVTIDVEPIEE